MSATNGATEKSPGTLLLDPRPQLEFSGDKMLNNTGLPLSLLVVATVFQELRKMSMETGPLLETTAI
jgi:hypothetical protein